MAWTSRRNQNTGTTVKRYVRSQTGNAQQDGAATIEDNATNLVGGSTDDPTLFAPHDYHPIDLAQQ